MLRVFFSLHREGFETGRKLSAYRETAALLGRSVRTICSIVKDWAQENHVENQTKANKTNANNSRKGNKSERPCRIPSTTECHVAIREYVCCRRINRERVTARKILDFLIEQNVIHVPQNEDGYMCTRGIQSALHCIRQYLRRRGFLRGKK